MFASNRTEQTIWAVTFLFSSAAIILAAVLI